MPKELTIFQTAGAMARHAGARQAVVARNIANADTPGYRARTIAPFAETYRTTTTSISARTSRPGHIIGSSSTASRIEMKDSASEPSPNGNTVSIEEEMMNSIEITREHTRALAIYRHAMTVLRVTVGR